MAKQRDPKYDWAYESYKVGRSLEQLAIEMGVSRQCVFKAFKKRGFQLRGKPAERPSQFFEGKRFSLRNSGYYSLTEGERTLMHRYVWEYYNGPIPAGHDIHHINEQKWDNRIENLECLPKSEHTRRYSPHNNQYTKGRKKCKL